VSATPALTALMPVRDYRAGYLREAVDSLLAQTSAAWRLAIVADGAAPAELRRALGGRCDDARIELVENEGRRLAGALNTGMRHASTPFVAILFADDAWEPHAVEVLERAIREHPEVDLFHSGRRFVDDDGTAISDVMPPRRDVTVADFGPDSPVCHLMCWRRDKGLAVGGIDEELDPIGPDDFDFPWTMAEQGAVLRDVPDCLYVIRDHRRHPRLTTHVPRSVHERATRRIMLKHGMDPLEVERFIRAAREGYLRQCLYRSRPERWLRERVGIGRPRPWRETYR
jgi:glycosyltransferase involved in cell wall biosynthesis